MSACAQDANGNGAAMGGNGSSPDADEDEDLPELWKQWHPKNPYEVRVDMPNHLLSPGLP